MARLHEIGDSEDELPDLSKILVSVNKSQHGLRDDQPPLSKPHRAPKAHVRSLSSIKDSTNRLLRISPIRGNVEASSGDQQARKQKPLRLAHVNSLLLPTANGRSESPVKRLITTKRSEKKGLLRKTPNQTAAQRVDFTSLVADSRDALDSTEDDSSSENLSDFIVNDSDSLSDFIVNDSASDREMEPLRSVKKYRSGSPRKLQKNIESNRGSNDNYVSRKPESLQATIDLISPDKKPDPAQKSVSYQVMAKTGPSQDDEFNVDPLSNLRLSVSPHCYIESVLSSCSSPLRSRSSPKTTDHECLVTPPPSPSKPKLQSPSKSKSRIPPSPHRPSLDAFWSQEIINDWNDQYSPQKTPKPRRLFFVDEEAEVDISPSGSPHKSPVKSPAKKDKEAIERKRIFDKEKHDLATTFLEELDRTVASGQVALLAAATGGIRIVWSKKLNSTAGRANWKREAIRTKNIDLTAPSTTYYHHAFIELAEKVIDDEGNFTSPYMFVHTLTLTSRPSPQRPCTRILPSRQLHDQQYQKQSARQGVQRMVGPTAPSSRSSLPPH